MVCNRNLYHGMTCHLVVISMFQPKLLLTVIFKTGQSITNRSRCFVSTRQGSMFVTVYIQFDCYYYEYLHMSDYILKSHFLSESIKR